VGPATGADATRRGLAVDEVEGPARHAGLRAGDCIVAVNGRRPHDVLDLETAAADGILWLRVLRDGRPLDLAVPGTEREWHGITLAAVLGMPPRTCRNRCRFCFVDQLPPGLRDTLYVKDDDYRLSFLHGTFITLTNLSPDDVARILGMRLSPLYISLHAWDGGARVALMGSAARSSVRVLERLSAGGIELHLQVVVCPGWNDGAVLEETVTRLAGLTGVEDVGLVPVSLAEEGGLRRVGRADAEAVLEAVGTWQGRFTRALGRDFVHAADEFYLLCERLPAASDAPLQYENGIGMSAHLLGEADEIAAGEPLRPVPPPLRLLGGTLARPVLDEACRRLAGAGLRCQPFVVANRLFGSHVTVTGLLGGREVVAALQADPLAPGEWLAAPRDFLPAALGRTLDDVAVADIEAACDDRLVLGDGLAEAFARLSR
jgi:putative radical SAM enzyme (TIGR03279 family)